MSFRLVTLSQAKQQVSLTADNQTHDWFLDDKILQASAILMRYIKLSAIPDAWTDDSTSPVTYVIPDDIQSAVLVMIAEAFANREAGGAMMLSDGVKDMLSQFWDPACA